MSPHGAALEHASLACVLLCGRGLESRAPDPARTLAAWRRFTTTGELVHDELPAHICRAWTRCRAAGTSPHTMVASTLDPLALAELLAHEHDLIEAAKPYMHALSRAAGAELHAAMLGSAEGIVLDVVGHEHHIAAAGFPGPGSRLCEAVAGANGIGTTLAEGRYVEVVGPEHFIEGFHIYTCQGVPLHGPKLAGAERLVGVLSLSVRRLEAAERVREILLCAAHGIEAELARRLLDAELVEVLSRGGEADALERLRQDILQLHAAARLRLDRAATQAVARDVSELARSAAELARTFRRRSELWRDLVSDTFGAPQPLDLQARVAELVELLATEAAVRGVQLRLIERAALLVSADARALAREILRAISRAMDETPRSAQLEIGVTDGAELSICDGRDTARTCLRSVEVAR